MDQRLTDELRQWLDNANRDYAQGAMLLYRLRANPVEYRKISADPNGFKDYIFRNLKKFYDFRSSNITHRQVVKTVEKAVAIAENAAVSSDNAERRSGKRPDHSSLPPDIQALYMENADIMRRIVDTHAKIRAIIQTNAACKDADLMPLSQHIIKLDKQRLANWKKYDEFTPPRLN